MSQETKPYRTNVHLTFPPAISGAPLVCNLTRLFDLDFNISTAQITPLCPSSALTVDIKTRLLAFDKEKCTVCARCIRICPVGAMQMDAPEEGVLTE